PLAVRTPPRIDDLSAQVRQLESRLTIATVRRPQQRKERSVRRDTHGPAVGRQPTLRAEFEGGEHDLADVGLGGGFDTRRSERHACSQHGCSQGTAQRRQLGPAHVKGLPTILVLLPEAEGKGGKEPRPRRRKPCWRTGCAMVGAMQRATPTEIPWSPIAG